ncbi:MAG: flagellar biosynthesis regulatory protein FlaF [Rhodospirillales bacterium]|nr:MAG: flagellar biosynthesis regulatory protein FlaF [Rhodospirillales bacterium]
MSDAYSHAALAYGTSGRATVSPRQLEAEVLLKAARNLEMVRRDWTDDVPDGLDPALLYNRKLWTVLADAVADDSNPLSLEIRNAVANLAVFVFKRTVEVQAGPVPSRLDVLIEINKQVAAGLLQSPGAAASGEAATDPHAGEGHHRKAATV